MSDTGAVAAVDCGTNSTRLLVMAPDGTVLGREMRITRLGEGVDASGRLSSSAIDRTLSVLRSYRRSMDEHAVGRVRVVATSAVRDALNAEEFMVPAEGITRVSPEILSGEEEGRLSFAGATARLPPELVGRVPLLVVDIGGGSTELVVGHNPAGDAGSVAEVAVRSLDIGCVRVSERFLPGDPPRPEDLARARAAVTASVVAARDGLPGLARDSLLVGLAGTVSTLASLQAGLTEYDRARIHHALLGRDDVDRWLVTLSTEHAHARLARAGMSAGREDVIVGGVLILAVVMSVFGLGVCLVSEDDILDGLTMSLLQSPGATG